MNPIRILLADDHEIVRAGIRSLLGSLTGMEVVGEARDGREALSMIETLRPHVVLMDIMMPELNGIDATAGIVKKYPSVRVVILSMNANEEYVLRALQAGAVGYLLKNTNPTELELAIRTAARGEPYLGSAISKQVIDGYLKRASGVAETPDVLTPRRREILQLIGEGSTTKEIARKLDLSVKTVEMHRSQLMETLQIHDIAGLVRYAIRIGLISAEK